MEAIQIINPPNEIRKVVVPLEKGSKVETFHKDETNINKIVARALKTKMLPQRGDAGFYGDFSETGDYQDCLERINLANERFMTLPAQIRKKFDNDPGKLLGFLGNPENVEKAIELGVIPKPVIPASEPDSEPVAEPEGDG